VLWRVRAPPRPSPYRSTHSTNCAGALSVTMNALSTRSSWYICFAASRASAAVANFAHVSGMLDAVPCRMMERSLNATGDVKPGGSSIATRFAGCSYLHTAGGVRQSTRLPDIGEQTASR